MHLELALPPNARDFKTFECGPRVVSLVSWGNGASYVQIGAQIRGVIWESAGRRRAIGLPFKLTCMLLWASQWKLPLNASRVARNELCLTQHGHSLKLINHRHRTGSRWGPVLNVRKYHPFQIGVIKFGNAAEYLLWAALQWNRTSISDDSLQQLLKEAPISLL